MFGPLLLPRVTGNLSKVLMKMTKSLLVALIIAGATQHAVQAQTLTEGLSSLGKAAGAIAGLRAPGFGHSGKSTSNSPDDPVFGQPRVEARAHPKYPDKEWPDKMIEGYIARDSYGCPAFFANGDSMFVYSFDKFEQKVNGAWVALDIMKLAKEVPQHCTGGG
ncbi:hypothetical protein [Pseudoduganella albidiflava]|uniref:Uncharacterized protein n=2 Tax=Pseudoduganella albidiflava TaxID=321983 RepID=A0ABX5RW73_9BURK|nr:hypothetical protein [Pseudoduganella albidiflava]QBI02307.1 hypothetical protein EYF70_16760 [Pseudoduganella albidiflava]